MRPSRIPIGLQLSQTARVVSRAFDEALDAEGGSLPVWLILLNLTIRKPDNQRELAEAVGVTEATLTHHLNAMDMRGLITRRRDTGNRRVHVVDLTEAGEEAFIRLQRAAVAFDTRLRNGFADADLDTLGELLNQLTANVGKSHDGPPWTGLAERPAQAGSPAPPG